MELNKKESRAKLFAPAVAIALACALVVLLISTFLLCTTLLTQLLPILLLVSFSLLAFFLMRTKWVKAHTGLSFALGTLLAAACGVVLHFLA